MRPRLHAVFTVDRGGEALAPVMTREMRRHVFDGVRMDQIGIRARVICTTMRSVMGFSMV